MVCLDACVYADRTADVQLQRQLAKEVKGWQEVVREERLVQETTLQEASERLEVLSGRSVEKGRKRARVVTIWAPVALDAWIS